MNYTIISSTGHKMKAHTEPQARELASRHIQQWKEAGCPVEVTCRIYYYDGTELK